jgi:hypothetical protein
MRSKGKSWRDHKEAKMFRGEDPAGKVEYERSREEKFRRHIKIEGHSWRDQGGKGERIRAIKERKRLRG